jgi:integrase/recombinase XerD
MQSHTKCNGTTINTRIRGLRAILYYMMKLEYVEKFNITIRKADKKIKTTYNGSELKLLIKKPDIQHCAFYEYRSWTICNVLLGTGIRAASLINLKINDVDFENQVFYLRHMKARRQIIIPMVITLKKILLEYLEFRQATKDDDFLFCSIYGMQLNTNSLAHSLRKYSLRRGVPHGGLHKFRHTFAKMYLQNGGSVFKLQKLLGHRGLEMTREYVELFSDDLKIDYDIINPLESLQNNKHIKMKPKNKR